MMSRLSWIAPLAAGVWHRLPNWLRGAITWAVNGKVIVGVSGVLLNDENQVLLLRHRFHNTRIWGLPGGWLSPGESIYDCWRREVREELEVRTSVETLVCHRANRRTLEFYLLGRISGGRLKIDPVEILEARFFSPDSLPSMESFSLGVVRQAFRLLQGETKTNRSDGQNQALSMAARYKGKEGNILTEGDDRAEGGLEKGDTLHA